MPKSDFINMAGTSANIKKELIETVVLNKPQADILFERIQQNQCLFSDDEQFTRLPSNKSEDVEPLNFLTNDASYFINMKYLTLALICLIFDIKFSQGFASLVLNLTGINFSAIKLDDMEKCLAYKIKAEKRIKIDQLHLLNCCSFADQTAKCRHYENDDTCRIWTEHEVQSAVDSLESKKIITKVDDEYKIIF